MAFFLIKFLESIFPFLFSALKRAYDNMTPYQQNALKNSGMVGQLLKNNLTALGTDLVTFISGKTGLSEQEVSDLLIALAKTFGLTTTSINDAVAFLQSKVSGAASDAEWNGLFQVILNAGATILSGGAIDWLHVALGLGEWVFQTFIKPTPAVSLVIPISTTAINPATNIAQASLSDLQNQQAMAVNSITQPN